MTDVKWENLIEEMKNGSVRALARLITSVENQQPGWMDAMRNIYADTGNAHVIGITGSPGAGKSTLTDRLTRAMVKKGHKVGIIAVDPSSPFTGGALLGDRLRMKETCMLKDVFVRSMATRGALGGLSLAARDIVKVMDAFGKDLILIETVGVGQDEVEVVKTADIVLVVCVPGQGDGIQAIKAGIMEIANIFVVNKADLEGADQVESDILSMLSLSMEKPSSKIPVLKTSAARGDGITELVDALFFSINSNKNNIKRQKERTREEILSLLEKEAARILRGKWENDVNFNNTINQVIAREKDPYSIVQKMTAPLIDS